MYNVKQIIYDNEVHYRIYSKPIKKLEKLPVEEEKALRDKSKLERKKSTEGETVDSEVIYNAEADFKVSNLNRAKDNIYKLALANKFDYFANITFNDSVDRYDYTKIVAKMSKFLNNYKSRKNPNLQYLIVPEKHKDGAYHFHGLFSGIEPSELEHAVNNKLGSKYYGLKMYVDYKTKERPIYNWKSYTCGFSQLTEIMDNEKACAYITKYITKELVESTKGKKRYWYSKGLKKPQINDIYIKELEDLHLELGSISTYRKQIRVDKEGFQNEITYYVIKNMEND